MREVGETGWLGGHVLARGGLHGVLAGGFIIPLLCICRKNDASLDIMVFVLDTTSIGHSQPYCSGV